MPDKELDNNLTSVSTVSNSLIEVNNTDLNQESLEILNQLIAEHDVEKTKDLTYLFNQNQNKKTMVRMDKLSDLQDKLVAQFAKRVQERPDEISNQDLLQALKITQNIVERGQKQIMGVDDTPLIQINQQTNTVNMTDDPTQTLNKDARERVKNVVANLLTNIVKDSTTTYSTTSIPSDYAHSYDLDKDEK